MKKFMTIFWCLAIFALLGSHLYAQDFKVIVNKSSTVTSMTKDQVSRLFLKKTTKFPDGTPAFPVDLVADSSLREQFSKDVLGQSVSSVRRYWQKQIFSGRGVPPPEKANDREILDYVKDKPGAIGYVSARTRTDDVTVITIID